MVVVDAVRRGEKSVCSRLKEAGRKKPSYIRANPS